MTEHTATTPAVVLYESKAVNIETETYNTYMYIHLLQGAGSSRNPMATDVIIVAYLETYHLTHSLPHPHTSTLTYHSLTQQTSITCTHVHTHTFLLATENMIEHS